jgi:hypothetical protein
MLPTKERSDIVKNRTNGRSMNTFIDHPSNLEDWEYQQLYIISNQPFVYPPKGTHYYDGEGGIRTAGTGAMYSLSSKNIIATSDKSLGIVTGDKLIDSETNTRELIGKLLPQIPQLFIKEYVEVNGIDNVLVEYKENISGGWVPSYNNPDNSNCDQPAEPDGTFSLKVNSDNTINIKPIKESWSREEVIESIREFGRHINQKYNPSHPVIGEVKSWAEENL